VVDRDPNNKVAVRSLASLEYCRAQGIADLNGKLRKLDDAARWYEQLALIDPTNKEAVYSLGVIAWAKSYPALMQARNRLGMKPEDPGPLRDPQVRQALRADYGGLVDEGIRNLERALELDPEYDDAMAYMNLLIRERADLADSPEEYAREVAEADRWVQKTLDTKARKAGKGQPSTSFTVPGGGGGGGGHRPR
jgi:tetratricopeptide (TPR) repeat protein